MATVPRIGSPILPASIAAFIRITGSKNRRWLTTPSLRPLRLAAPIIASHSENSRGERFLYQHVGAIFDSGQRALRVERVWCTHDQNFNAGAGNHLRAVGEIRH